MNKQFTDNYLNALRAATPIAAVATPDPAATEDHLKRIVNERYQNMLVYHWDCVRGFLPRNRAATEQPLDDMFLTQPEVAIGEMSKLPDRSIVFAHSLERYINAMSREGSAMLVQAIWNLRDQFKTTNRQLVMLAPSWRLPAELADVLVLDEPLPSQEEVAAIIEATIASSNDSRQKEGLSTWEMEETQKWTSTQAMIGLSAFTVEQAVSMNLCGNDGRLDNRSLLDHKKTHIRAVEGLGVDEFPYTYKDMAGYENAKRFVHNLATGRDPVTLVLRMDEIEKGFAGTQGDTSGTSQEMHGLWLPFHEYKCVSVLCNGAPGTGKSLLSQAIGNEVGLLTVSCDLARMKSQYVGESIHNLTRAMKTLDAMSGGGRILLIATCNSLQNLSPELQRRFLQKFYFPIPTREERMNIWSIWLDKYGLNAHGKVPDQEGFTGAEIKKICEIAWRLNISLEEAAPYVIPYVVSNKAAYEQLEEMADGTLQSASVPGPYRRSIPEDALEVAGRGRAFAAR